jgi:tetratricopeptide (TPR) repeat protein
MAHVSEEQLIRYTLDRALTDDAEGIERHLAECAECRQLLDSITAFDAALRDPDAWAAVPESPGFEELRRLAENVAAEDAEAQQLLAEFGDAPAALFAWADLPSNPAYHTGGIVRALCKRANGMCERDPRYALVLADAAIGIAAVLPERAYPAAALHEWRGEAWKEQANALHHLGRFDEALTALDNAENEYRQLTHFGLGQVAVMYVRALVLFEQERFEAAERLAAESGSAALHLGSIDRYMRARHLQGQILFYKPDIPGATVLFEEVLRYGEAHGSSIWIARESLTLGNCWLEVMDLDRTRMYLLEALRRFKVLKLDAEVTRTEWALARLLFAEGAPNEAISRLRKCIADLTRFQMLTDAAIASVHLAEMLNATDQKREIPKLLKGMVRTFASAGKTTGALMALAYLKDAAVAGTMTAEVAAHVRRFIGRAEHQPELLFAPPPDPV